MALHEIPEIATSITTANETLRIRREFLRMGKEMQKSLKVIRSSVAKAGQGNVATELGDDVAAMLIAFNETKDLIEILLDVVEPGLGG